MKLDKKNFGIEFSPFGQSPNGEFTIKTMDSLKFPLATVHVPIGTKNAKEKAKEKALYITSCLNNYPVVVNFVKNIDTGELKKQKEQLLNCINDKRESSCEITKNEANLLDGILHLIDSLQDVAIETELFTEKEVFN